MRGALIEGLDDDKLCERFGGCSLQEVDELRRKFLDYEAEQLRSTSTEHRYVEYVLEMQHCIADLEKVVSNFAVSNQVSAYVGAVRAKADLLDRIIKTGQEFGLIERKSDGKGAEAGEAIKGLTNPEIKQYIVKEIQIFNNVMLKFGDQNITDLDPGPIYAAMSSAIPKNPVPTLPPTKVQGRARNPVHHGRRVVR